MASSLEKFLARPTSEVHPHYAGSVLAPVAPEYTTGEGLVAAAYRTLLLGVTDQSVNLATIRRLPDDLAERVEQDDLIAGPARAPFLESWRDLVFGDGGLSSPTPAGSQARLPQLMPLVPRLGYRSGVIGAYGRGRWQPGTLLLSAIWTGSGPSAAPAVVEQLRSALEVAPGDDLFARYVEDCLAMVEPAPQIPSIEDLEEIGSRAAGWRPERRGGHIPAERFVDDLRHVIELKPRLTRRQWTALLEAQLRIGLAMHQMWLCRFNVRIWELALRAMAGERIDVNVVLAYAWRSQEEDAPFLQLGADSVPAMRRLLADYARARLGLNLLLYALDDAAEGWPRELGRDAASPAQALAEFSLHVTNNAAAIDENLSRSSGGQGLVATTGHLTDHSPKLVNARLGVTRNLLFFLRYTLGQLQPVDAEQATYDQGFLIHRPIRTTGNERPVRPGPTALILLIHNTCRSVGRVPASMDLLRRQLAGYGVAASADELRTGSTVLELERLELVVDSPDAGGGRLLVDPLDVVSRPNA